MDISDEVSPRSDIAVEQKDGVATVLIARGDKHNALTSAMRSSLLEAFRWASDDTSVRVVVLRGEGPSFCSGQDIKEKRPVETSTRTGIWRREFENLGSAISSCPVPVIAALHGHVLGRGLDLALAADLRIAGDDARFGYPEVKYGMVVGGGGSRRLVRAVGESRAMDMLLCGDTVDAQTALSWGLVTRLVPNVLLDGEVRSLASSLAAMPDLSLYATKTIVRQSSDVPLAAGSWTDTALNSLLATEREGNSLSRGLGPSDR